MGHNKKMQYFIFGTMYMYEECGKHTDVEI